MNRAAITFGLLVLFFGVAFGLRTLRQVQRTGDAGFRGISPRVGSAAWLGGVLFVVGIVLAVVAPAAELASWGTVREAAPPLWLDVASLVVALLGIAGTYWSQVAMGESWRIGVAESERTELVRRGPFRWVRNPIFSFMLLTSAAIAAFMPNALSLAALAALLAAVELQVRFAEEPHLLREHGEAYAAYGRAVGRFVPGIGKLASGIGR